MIITTRSGKQFQIELQHVYNLAMIYSKSMQSYAKDYLYTPSEFAYYMHNCIAVLPSDVLDLEDTPVLADENKHSFNFDTIETMWFMGEDPEDWFYPEKFTSSSSEPDIYIDEEGYYMQEWAELFS